MHEPVTRSQNAIRSLPLAVLLVALAVGCSGGDSEQADSTTVPAAVTTPDGLKLAVYERAYSECASTELARLTAKYKVADKTKTGVASAVAQEWVEFLQAGQDAVSDGRSGCLQGFEHR
jgi:type IV pilus biogenesis protein CpaD/CtpE